MAERISRRHKDPGIREVEASTCDEVAFLVPVKEREPYV
jgi:hypothetical protein